MQIPSVCEYCGGRVIFTDASVVRGKKGENIYLCLTCNAFVGVHKGSKRPLGTLANTVLRLKRQEAHRQFDAIWQSKSMTRSQAYAWLAERMNMPKHCAHIGHFNVAQCDLVIEICRRRENEQEVA